MHLRTLNGTSEIQLEPLICTESQQDQENFVYSSVSSVIFAMKSTDMDKCICNLKGKNPKLCLLMCVVCPVYLIFQM